MAYSAMPGVAEATSQSMKAPPGLRFRSPKGFHVLSRGFIPVRNREKSLKTDLDAIALPYGIICYFGPAFFYALVIRADFPLFKMKILFRAVGRANL
jgi:hypothetical protein